MHDEFKTQALTRCKKNTRMLPYWCIQNHRKLLRDGGCGRFHQSTDRCCENIAHQRLIVATDRGIFYKMQQAGQIKSYWKHQPRVRAQPVAARALSVDGHEWPSGHRRGIRTEGSNHEVYVDERLRERALVRSIVCWILRLHYVDN